MINKLHLQNFQLHKDTTLELDKGINIISGSSDNGKSSIIRAIRWVLQNRPSGEGFRTYGCQDDTKVELVVNGARIARCRGKNSNSYQDDKAEYKALRSDVPTEISEVLNILPCSLQTQHEPYYLLQNSPGDVAKQINTFANLEVIEETVTNIKQHVSAKKEAAVAASVLLDNYQSQAQKLKITEGDRSAFEELEKDQKDVTRKNAQIAQLQVLVGQLQMAVTNQEKLHVPISTLAHGLERLDGVLPKYEAEVRQLQTLKKVCEQAKRLQDSMISLTKVTKCASDINKCETLAEQTTARITRRAMIAQKMLEITAHAGNADKQQVVCTKITQELEDLRKENPLCPVCGNIWNGEMI